MPNSPLLAVALATFMTYLDNNIVNVAMPAIQRDLHLGISSLEWVVSSYIVVFASLLLSGGRLADVFGRKRLFQIGLGIFTAASLAAGLAADSNTLVVARAVQGLGAAMVTPTTLAIISATSTDARKRAAAVGSGAGSEPSLWQSVRYWAACSASRDIVKTCGSRSFRRLPDRRCARLSVR